MNCLAADFGGTSIKLGVVESETVLATRVIPTRPDIPLPEQLENVALRLEELCEQLKLHPGDCEGIGISYPSIIDSKNARILDDFGKFGDARAFDLRRWAKDRLGLHLAIDNDARMALIGEWRHGAGKGFDNCVIITLGTGIGVSAVMEGQVLRGVHGQAAILGGHVTIDPGGELCVCGNIGCAEHYASQSAIGALARKRPDFNTSALAKEPVINYEAVFRLAEEGDNCAITLIEDSIRIWSVAAVNMVHVFDPEIVILGGGIMRAGDKITAPVQSYVARHAHTPWGKVKVVRSQLGEGAALMACQWLVREEVRRMNK